MTDLLRKYSKRKHGWKVEFILDEDKKILEGGVFVVKDKAKFIIKNPEPKELEKQVTAFIKNREEKDMETFAREKLLFAGFVKTLRSQSQYFVGFLTNEAKHKLTLFNNHSDKMVKSLGNDYEVILGKEKYDQLMDSFEDMNFTVFTKLRDAILEGKAEKFMEYVNNFDKSEVEDGCEG